MTFSDDYMTFEFLAGHSRKVRLLEFGMQWPPPAELEFCGFPFVRVAMSAATDEERRAHPDITRGALYRGSDPPVLRP